MKYIKKYLDHFNKTSPIGLFDSGYGGLTVLRELQKVLPDFDFVYLSDNKRAPYGTRSDDEIIKFTIDGINFLLKKGCKKIVVACNTATAVAIEILRSEFQDSEIEIFDVITPTCITVKNITNTNSVGLLATDTTVESDYYGRMLQNSEILLSQWPCKEWVKLIENLEHDTENGRRIIKNDIETLLSMDNNIDTIILGCTHFAILENIIQEFIDERISLVNQSRVMSSYLPQILDSNVSKNGLCRYFTTESNIEFDKEYRMLFGDGVESVTVII